MSIVDANARFLNRSLVTSKNVIVAEAAKLVYEKERRIGAEADI